MSTKFTEYKGLDLPAVASEVLDFWKEENIFEKSVTTREGAEPFVFFEGPPSANGLPGIHHVMARAIKDIFCRYKTQKGFQVKRKAGWDTHGLPVELGTEKELGITKEDIGKTISIEEYNEACKKTVMRYTDVWNDLTEKMGYWVDMEDPYVTYKPKYMESVWWLLKQIYDKGLLYKGYTIQPYSPKAGTGLSSHEVNQPGAYRDVTDTTIVAQFKTLPETLPGFLQGFGDVHILAWTTTPWTLPSNTALTVGPKIDYVLVKTFNQYTFEPINVVLAKNLVGKQFGKGFFSIDGDEKLEEILLNSNGSIEEFRIGIYDEISLLGLEIKSMGSDENVFKSRITFLNTVVEKQLPYKILTEAKGSDLVGIRYEQLLNWAQPYENPENAYRVILGDFVTTEDGTGIVHTAPTFGADDAKVAKEASPVVPPMLVNSFHNLIASNNPNKDNSIVKDDEDYFANSSFETKYQILVPLVDLQGKFIDIDTVPEKFRGMYVKNEYYDAGEAPERSADVEIAIQLKEENKAFKVEKYVHSYPHSWRTDEPLLYYPLDSWFIKVTDVKDRMFDLNETINWKPKSTGEGRFGNWLKNANDWNLSRSRYWGIPLPIWRTEDKKEEVLIGSVEELYNAIEKSIEAGFQKENPFKGFEIGNMAESNYDLIDLHKNVVDAITLVSASGQPMKRESDLIDVWFDSGAMPYAQWHYPFENKDKIDENKDFPANFIAEGVDQTRGWFYTLHAIGTLVFDKVAYKNVVSNGLVLDKNGIKMSKSKGNTIDPFKTIAEYGPDATRWYMIMNANPWDNLKFDLEGIAEVRRKFFGTLYNTYSFFSLYANIDGFKYEEAEIPLNERPEIDQWIISELHSLIKYVDECYEDYEPTKAARAISDFVQENLSNWYVRLCRRRFWKGEYAHDKIAAYQTLYTCLLTISKLSAPIAPFFMDKLYRDLTISTETEQYSSVHLAEFPKFVENFVNKTLESKMQKAQTISSLVLSLRKKEMIKVRQPLQKVMIPVLDENQRAEIQAISELIKAEVNVKEIILLDDDSGILVKQIKPNFKALGPRFGKDMGLISKEIQSFSADQINQLDKQGTLDIVIAGNSVTLSLEDVEITSQDIEGWLVANSNGITVALDITISEELKNEGIARELVNRIQNIRKDSGFEVTDKIKVQIVRSGILEEAILKNEDYIKSETLTDELVFVAALENGTEIEFDDIKTMILISK
jgi:isoleucyl-tRNA synthetase